MSEDERRSVRLSIAGRVQGVWYRGWAVEQAQNRNLDGWVRNRSDGTVEMLIAGAPDEVESMIKACWRGPGPAHVLDIRVYPAADPGAVGFQQVPTL